MTATQQLALLLQSGLIADSSAKGHKRGNRDRLSNGAGTIGVGPKRCPHAGTSRRGYMPRIWRKR
jgi:hypothetical protein